MIEAALRLQRAAFALDVELALPAPGASALFGPSGCGKTTVLRALAGLERGAGRVVVEGEIWQDDAAGLFLPPHRRPIGYVIQEAALFPHLSVRANVEYGIRRHVGARIDLAPLIELLGIGALMDRRPATLSGGERQRVAIARALAGDPPLILADEPTAALDAKTGLLVTTLLRDLSRERGDTVVVVTHDNRIFHLADRIVHIEDGVIQQETTEGSS